MDKNEFKDLLLDLLDEYGEQELGMIDIITYDKEDKFLIVLPNQDKFEIYVKKLQ